MNNTTKLKKCQWREASDNTPTKYTLMVLIFLVKISLLVLKKLVPKFIEFTVSWDAS
jgi:hypothetical protein